jgi:hypothetical protein
MHHPGQEKQLLQYIDIMHHPKQEKQLLYKYYAPPWRKVTTMDMYTPHHPLTIDRYGVRI